MAGETRTAFDRVGWLRELASAPFRFDFHQALRRLEVAFGDLPRWGQGAKPRDEPVRFGQDPSLAFAPSALGEFRPPTDDKPAQLLVAFFGLFGPNGPLPLHLTEYARERIRHAGDATFASFLDLFHHRMLVLFHRAWAQSRPTVSRDRRSSDRYLAYVGATFGLGLSASRGIDPVPDRAKLYFAGLLAQSAKHPSGLQALLASYFGVPVRVREFIGEWLVLADSDRFRLGHSAEVSTIGRSTVLGRRVFSRTSKFRVVLGPLSERDFKRFLPGTQGMQELSSLVRAYVGLALAWDVELVPMVDDARQLWLGKAGRLGFNALLGSGRARKKLAHVIVDPLSNQTQRTLA
jgi:type VI secretion system protein ImpH